MDGAQEVLEHLVEKGFLESDGDLLFIGHAAEARFGRRHFMDLTAVFTADPEMKVVNGRSELGSVSPASLTVRLPEGQPRVLALAGRAWVVTHVDWPRRTAWVAAHEGRGHSRWGRGGADLGGAGLGGTGLGRELAQSIRAVLLGEDPGVVLSRRGATALERLRRERSATVHPDGTVLQGEDSASRWWTFAGAAANTSLAAALGLSGIEAAGDSFGVTIQGRAEEGPLRAAVAQGADAVPDISDEGLDGLKFSAAQAGTSPPRCWQSA